MTTNSIAEQLKGAFPKLEVLAAPEDLIPYSFDGTAAIQKLPEAVIFPTSTEEVQAVMRFANEKEIPLVTRGSGTGLSGGSVPAPNCMVVCLVKMNRILEVDTNNLTLLAEPGVVTQEIAEAAAKSGLFYPPDPGSMKISTIGGNIAENSGGLRGLKYGVTRNYVMGLEVVLPDGQLLWTGNKCVKDVAGYSLKDLFVGSEGTLGIVTKILLRLVPQPEARRTLLAVYNDMGAAAETVSAIIREKIIPCTLEFLDRTTIHCVEDYAKIGLPMDAEAILLMETDGPAGAVEREAAAMERLAGEHGAREVQTAKDDADALRLAAARRTAFAALARVGPTTILEDATVPRSELPGMIRFIQEVAERHQLKVGTFGHMGDGNLHPTFLTDEKNEEEMHRVELAMKEIFDYAVKIGGTITGEHGVGLAKKPFLRDALGDVSINLMRQFKRTLDPKNILNPDKMLPET